LSYSIKLYILLAFLFYSKSTFWSQSTDTQSDFRPSSEIFDKTELLVQIKSEYTNDIKSIDTEALSSKQVSVLKKTYLERYKAEKALIESHNTILTGTLYNYVNDIFKSILDSNPEIDQNSKLVLFRDRNFNAFTLGNNIIFVNIGLLYRFSNKDQVAMVIAHEIAHNVKDHCYKKILENVKFQTDSELNAQIKKISNSEYGQVSALNELLIPSILELKEQSRNHEFEADSLGLVYYINAGYSEQHLDDIFKIMEVADKIDNPELIEFEKVFKPINGNSSFRSRYNSYSRSSSLGAFEEEEEDELEPYLRSHPYEKERLQTLKSHILTYEKDTSLKVDSSYLKIKYFIEGEMVYSSIGDANYSDLFYYGMRMHQKYTTDNYSSSALSFMFSMLSYYKSTRMSGKFIDAQNPELDEVVDRSNYFLTILSPEECLKISKEIRNNWVKAGYESILIDLTEMTYDFHSKNYESMVLRLDKIDPVIKETLLEKSLNLLKEDPSVKGKI